MKYDLTGQRFGRLTVEKHVVDYPTSRGARTGWLCRCDCGGKVVVATYPLTSGHTRSCGCLRREATSKNHARTLGHYKGTAISKINPERKANRDSELGVKGVSWYRKKQKFRAMIYLRGRTKHLGYFDTIKEAIEARKVAEAQYFSPIIKEYEEENKNEKEN